MKPEDGSFAEHITAKGDVAMKVPSNVELDDVVTVPCSLITIGLAFYSHLGLPMLPATVEGGKWIFVYGGSSATGTIAIQFAKL